MKRPDFIQELEAQRIIKEKTKLQSDEFYKDIPNYENMYQISNLGNVKSLKYRKEKILKFSKDKDGYFQVILCKNGKTKAFKNHVLVAMAFKGHKPDGSTKIVVDHIDNDKSNNCEWNLQLISSRENISKDRKSKNKYPGVRLLSNNKWEASITIENKYFYLGTFNNEIDAYNAYRTKLNNFKS
jgi:hypothetical protein